MDAGSGRVRSRAVRRVARGVTARCARYFERASYYLASSSRLRRRFRERERAERFRRVPVVILHLRIRPRLQQ